MWKDEENKEPSFSLNDFRKWVDNQNEELEKRPKLIGTLVESKANIKKLISKMEPEDGELYEMAKDFRRHGGKIIGADLEGKIIVEVKTGTFLIPKNCIKRHN